MLEIAVCVRRQLLAGRVSRMVRESLGQNGIPAGYHMFKDEAEFLQSDLKTVDVVFVETEMGAHGGMELARVYREKNPRGIIVFVSDDLRLVLQGYTVGAFRYLLNSELETTLPACVQDIIERLHICRGSLLIKTRQGEHTVPVEKIRYLESDGRRVHVFVEWEKIARFTYYAKLSVLNRVLSDRGFLWVNKSFLVNMKRITHIKNRQVFLDTGETFNCGRAAYKANAERYRRWKGEEEQSGGR